MQPGNVRIPARGALQLDRRQALQLTVGGLALLLPDMVRGAGPSEATHPLVAILMGGYTSRDSAADLEARGLEEGLLELGWRDGENITLQYYWPGTGPGSDDATAASAVARTPNVVISRTTVTSQAILRQTETVPVIFVLISDPIAAGLAQSFAHPGGHATGFTNFEASVAGKWIELLRQTTPNLRRVHVLFNPTTTKAFFPSYLAAAQDAAVSYGIEVLPAPTTNPAELEPMVREAAATPGSGVVGIADGWITQHRDEIASTLNSYKLPGIFANRALMKSGALMSYSVDYVEIFRRSASYVDRILKGEKAGDLPVQAPTRYRLSINLKTAREIGITIPPALLALADEVVEQASR